MQLMTIPQPSSTTLANAVTQKLWYKSQKLNYWAFGLWQLMAISSARMKQDPNIPQTLKTTYPVQTSFFGLISCCQTHT